MDKFEYYERKIDQMGQIDSNIEARGLQSEFDELEKQEAIDKELEALKSKLRQNLCSRQVPSWMFLNSSSPSSHWFLSS